LTTCRAKDRNYLHFYKALLRHFGAKYLSFQIEVLTLTCQTAANQLEYETTAEQPVPQSPAASVCCDGHILFAFR